MDSVWEVYGESMRKSQRTSDQLKQVESFKDREL